MGRAAPRLNLSDHDRRVLDRWSRSRTRAARVVLRSQIVLRLADGESVSGVAAALGVAPATVRLWAKRFREQGASGLLRDADGRGRKPALADDARQAVLAGVGTDDAPTTRDLAKRFRVSASTISRWRRRIQ